MIRKTRGKAIEEDKIKMKKFKANFIEEETTFIQDKIVGHSRWSVQHEQVFKHNDKYYQYIYSVGATEMQSGYGFDPEEMIECQEVIPVQKLITVYEPIKEEE